MPELDISGIVVQTPVHPGLLVLGLVDSLAAVLVDMDGTLVDSEILWDIAVRDISIAMGREIDTATRKRTLGASMPGFFAILSEYTGTPVDTDEKFQYWRQKLTDRVAQLFATDMQWRSGARELLDSIRAAGVPLALVTNTEAELASGPIDFIGRDRFAAIITGDAVANTKPAPDPYLAAAQALGVKAHHCIAIEDSVTGTRSAVSAGCQVLYVPSTHGQPDVEGAVRHPSLVGVDLSKLHRLVNMGQ